MEEQADKLLIDTKNMGNPTITGVDITFDIKSTCGPARDWKNLQQRARRNHWSIMKQVLVDALKQQIRLMGIVHRNYSAGVLVIDLVCGSHATYMTWADIPDHDVPCPCGNPKHWLIRYHDMRGKK